VLVDVANLHYFIKIKYLKYIFIIFKYLLITIPRDVKCRPKDVGPIGMYIGLPPLSM
jgi:hypothetical protein